MSMFRSKITSETSVLVEVEEDDHGKTELLQVADLSEHVDDKHSNFFALFHLQTTPKSTRKIPISKQIDLRTSSTQK